MAMLELRNCNAGEFFKEKMERVLTGYLLALATAA